MDGTGRISKRNRRFLRPIVPYNQQLAPQLPLQTFPADLVRQPVNNPGRVFHEVQDEFTSELRDKDNQFVQNTEIQMTDADFDAGLTDAVNNVQPTKQPTAAVKLPSVQLSNTDNNRPKRVKFATKRYVEQ